MIYVIIALLLVIAFVLYSSDRKLKAKVIKLAQLEDKLAGSKDAYEKEVASHNSAVIELKRMSDRVDVLEREKAELDEECEFLGESVDELKTKLGEYESYKDLKVECAGLSQQVNMLTNIRERNEIEINELTELLDQQKKANLGSVPVTDWVVGTTALARYIKRNAKQTRQLLQNDIAFPAYFANVGANKIWDRKLVDRWLEQVGE